MLKEWWRGTREIFSFRAEIKLLNLSFSINALCIKINLETDLPPLGNYWTSLCAGILPLSKNKTAEIQITFSNNMITGIHIHKSIHTDHTPFNIEISLLGITLLFTVYDHRHWDDDKNNYEEHEP